MIRKTFVMQLLPGMEAEYERRHNPIWPELEQTLREHGGHNYSIFLHTATLQLFGYVEIESEERWNAVASTAICRKWWEHMAPLMETHPDNSPKATALREVFHIA